MLLDLLVSEGAAKIAAAVAALRGDQVPNFNRFETAGDPSTWRLVNMMKVARGLNRVRPIDVPETLRDMRNYVHPAAMKAQNLVEAALEPEAVTAGGLIGIVKRDIQA
jgi:hypothetical protein